MLTSNGWRVDACTDEQVKQAHSWRKRAATDVLREISDVWYSFATKYCFFSVACKRRSSVSSGAWLRRFDDVTGVLKSCVAKWINRKKQRKNILLLQINMRLPQTSNAWMFAMFKNFINSQLFKPFLVPEPLWNSDNQKSSN